MNNKSDSVFFDDYAQATSSNIAALELFSLEPPKGKRGRTVRAHRKFYYARKAAK